MFLIGVSIFMGVMSASGVWFFWQAKLERVWAINLGRAQVPARPFFSRKKKLQIDMELADFLDLMALGLSSGLNLEKAWRLGAEHMRIKHLKDELLWVHKSLQLGRAREEAFLALDQRLDQKHLHLFFALLIQGIRAGSRIQNLLYDQAAMLRQRRLYEWERRAQMAPLRMLVPLFVFIFPTLFILLFAPLFIRFSQGMSFF